MEHSAALGAVVGMLAFGAIGSVFGGMAGTLAARNGRAAGARVGRWLADSFASVSDRPLSPAAYGSLVGAGEGAFFLGLVGLGVGLFASFDVLIWMVAGLIALCLLAALFGAFAYALIGRSRWVAFVCGPVVGWLVGYCLTEGNGYAGLAGTVLSIVAIGLVREFKERPGDGRHVA
jgi:hypothetical protein